MTRKSILVVTRNYPPLNGGMERLLKHSVESLSSQFDVTLIGPTGCSEFAPQGVETIECSPSPFFFLTMGLLKGWRASRKKSFDTVLGGSGLVAPVTLFLSRVARARSAIFVHGLDLVVENWVYQLLFVPLLRHHDRLIANSQNTRRIAIDKGCQLSRVQVVHPGSTIPPDSLLRDVASIRATLGFEENKVLLFVGRMVRRKGLAEFLEKAWPRIVETQPGAVLLVVGDSPDDALKRDSRSAQQLISLIKSYDDDAVRFMGSVSDETLWQCYAAADVLVFPLIRVKGDVEGFGMVAIEAAACGTPTVAFSVGGVPDAVADGRSGILVAEGDYPAFAGAVDAVCNSAKPSAAECSAHAQNFSWDVFGANLISVLADDLEA